jgi:hypothetical protein
MTDNATPHRNLFGSQPVCSATQPSIDAPTTGHFMHGIIYIIGLIVVVLAALSFIGLH